MSMVPWGHLIGLEELERAVGRLAREGVPAIGFPVDVEETAEHILLRAELPGVKAGDIQVEMTGEELTIRTERKRPTDGGDELLRERRYGTMERTFQIGVPVEAEGIEAVYEDGVLTVRLPKAPEGRTKVIPVRAS